MADLATITIPVDSSAMVRAVKDAKSLEGSIKLLTNALDSGVIGQKQFDAGLAQLEKQFKNLFKSADGATSSILGYVQSLRESKSATEAAAKSKDNLAMATKRAETAFALANQKAQEELQTLKNRAEFAWAMAMQRERESQAAVRAAEQQAKAEANLTAELLRQRNAVEQATRAKAQAAQAQIGPNLGLGARGISASASAGAYEAEIERLRQKFDKTYVAAQLYQNSLAELNRAHMLGVTSTKQHEAAVESLRAEYQAFQTGTATASNRFSQYTAQNASSMNQFGVVVQQAGYQVGDFLVQIQSGTNPLVAFGQQATQLVGILPLMGAGFMGLSAGALVALSAGLGIAIPLVTAIGAAFMRTGESANEGAGGVDNYAKAMEALTAEIQRNQEAFLQLKFDTESSGVARSRQEMEDLRNEIPKVREQVEALNNALRSMGPEGAIFSLFGGDSGLSDLEARLAGLEAMLSTLEAQEEAQRMLNGGLSVAAGIQKGLVYDKTVELRLAKEQAVEETKAEDLARRKKDAFHAMAGEMGAVSSAMFNANDGAASILSNLVGATNAAMGLRDALGQVESAAASRADRIASLTAQIAAASRGASVSAAQAQAETAAQLSRTGASLDQIAAAAQNAGEQAKEIEKLEGSLRDLTKTSGGAAGGTKKLKEELTAAQKAAQDFANAMDGYVVSAVGGVADAFGDFITRGFKDFKGFVKDVIGSFKNMIAQMIAIALRNKILIGLGFATAGAGGAGAVMGSGFGTAGLGGMISTAASGFGSGFMTSVYGGLGGTAGAVSGGLSVGGLSGISTAIGAIAAPLLAVAAVFSFFKKKTKELDSGLRITVGNMDALVETFRTVQTTRFFGLSKKVKTTVEEASAEVSDPVIKAIQDIQTQVIKAAEMFGIAESEFEDFVYKFDVSLKGLTDEQKIQKINEELLKMGDAFASLTGHFTSMNELLAAAQQRYDLQTRLLELQGDTEALLARQRELELAAVHDLNRELLLQIHALEDQQRALQAYQQTLNETTQALEEANRAYESALGDLRNAMARQLSEAQSALDSAKSVFDTALSNRYETLQNNLSSTEQALADAQQALAEAQRRAFEEGIQNRITAVNASFNSLIANLEARLDVAQRKAAASREIFEALDSALRDRRLASDAATFASRRSALSYVSSGGTDIDKLTSALGILNEPSEQFFGTFQDYARDFALTTNAIKENRDLAEATMTADEKTVMLLEQQIEQSRASQEAQVEALEKMLVVQEDFLTVSQAMEQLLAAQENYDQAKEAHDELLLQYPQLQETFISVGDALANYLAAQATYEQVQAQHAELVAQFPMLNESVLTVAQAVTNLQSAIAAQAAATAAQTAAQTALANAIAAANQAATTEAVPGFAVGGMHIGGPRIVGENGPELEVTGPSRIYSNRDTAAMFRDPNLASAVDGLRKEVSGMRSEQLQIQVEVSKNVKRIYDIERKWDTDGLPPERV